MAVKIICAQKIYRDPYFIFETTWTEKTRKKSQQALQPKNNRKCKNPRKPNRSRLQNDSLKFTESTQGKSTKSISISFRSCVNPKLSIKLSRNGRH